MDGDDALQKFEAVATQKTNPLQPDQIIAQELQNDDTTIRAPFAGVGLDQASDAARGSPTANGLASVVSAPNGVAEAFKKVPLAAGFNLSSLDQPAGPEQLADCNQNNLLCGSKRLFK